MQKKCMKCGLQNEPGAAYCIECGHEFSCVDRRAGLWYKAKTIIPGALILSVLLLLQYILRHVRKNCI